MKIGVVGTGLVGSTAAYALVMKGIASELVLIDLDKERAKGEAMDVSHATPFAAPVRVKAGDYSDLVDSEVVIVAAGANQRPDETRLDLLQKNTAIFRKIIPIISKSAPEAILLIATNPVDALTHIAFKVSGTAKERVIGSGTTLDTARLRAMVAAKAQVSPQNVHGYVLGEHGDSEFVAWSNLQVAGMSLKSYFANRQIGWTEADEEEMQQEVRRAAYEIIRCKGATYYGVASALSRVCAAIAYDEQRVLTVSMSDGEVAYSLPRVLGKGGVLATLELELDKTEQINLENSIRIISKAIRQVG